MQLVATIVVVGIIVVAIMTFVIWGRGQEAYADSATKARAVAEWFATNSSPSYAEFRRGTGLSVVDYEAALVANRPEI